MRGCGWAGGPRRREPLRAGYLGHLTLVANRMEGAAARRPAVRAFLEDSNEWLKYAAGPLQVPLLLQVSKLAPHAALTRSACTDQRITDLPCFAALE